MQSTPKTLPGLRPSIWRILGGYVAGCVLAGLWVSIWLGEPFPNFDPDTYETLPVGPMDYVSTWLFLTMIALVGCLIPVAIGRGLMLWRGTTAPVLFALIWAVAGTLVAGGFDPRTWFDAELLTAFFIPGAIIGVLVWRLETWGLIG